ncbi:MAG: hypothetical protein AB9897_07490 [Anaerolineaceae bacterium]
MIGIVGVCASGKSTLTQNLHEIGVNCRHIAQEHSYVKDMWQRLTKPDFLIFLQVSYPNTLIRRKLNWTLDEYQEQLFRLRHAFEYADLIIDTDLLTQEQVLELVTSTLLEHGLMSCLYFLHK